MLSVLEVKRKLPQKFVEYQNILTGQQAHDQMKAWDVQVLTK